MAYRDADRAEAFRQALRAGGGGLFLVYGRSGTGKTLFLRDALRDKRVLWLTSEQVRELLLEELRLRRPAEAAPYEYVVIDNLESLRGEATLQRFSALLDRWTAEGRTVAMTTCDPGRTGLRTRAPIRRLSAEVWLRG